MYFGLRFVWFFRSRIKSWIRVYLRTFYGWQPFLWAGVGGHCLVNSHVLCVDFVHCLLSALRVWFDLVVRGQGSEISLVYVFSKCTPV